MSANDPLVRCQICACSRQVSPNAQLFPASLLLNHVAAHIHYRPHRCANCDFDAIEAGELMLHTQQYPDHIINFYAAQNSYLEELCNTMVEQCKQRTNLPLSMLQSGVEVEHQEQREPFEHIDVENEFKEEEEEEVDYFISQQQVASTTSKRRLNYEEIRRFTDEKAFDQWIKSTGWTRHNRISRVVAAYHCKFFKKKGYNCKARLRVIRPQGSPNLIRVEQSEGHDHQPKVRLEGPMKLTEEVKRIIREQMNEGKTAQQILHLLHRLYRDHPNDVPTLLQIQNQIKQMRKAEKLRNYNQHISFCLGQV